jgi:hypothetical protein
MVVPAEDPPAVPEFPAEPEAPTTPADEAPTTLAVAGWTLLGGGAALAAAGGAAFGVLAEQERDVVENSAAGTPWRDVEPHVAKQEDYRNAEIAMLVVGGAALAAGAVLLILDATSEAPVAETAVVPLVGGGFGLGVIGRF